MSILPCSIRTRSQRLKDDGLIFDLKIMAKCRNEYRSIIIIGIGIR
jgi:hypothetical protein